MEARPCLQLWYRPFHGRPSYSHSRMPTVMIPPCILQSTQLVLAHSRSVLPYLFYLPYVFWSPFFSHLISIMRASHEFRICYPACFFLHSAILMKIFLIVFIILRILRIFNETWSQQLRSFHVWAKNIWVPSPYHAKIFIEWKFSNTVSLMNYPFLFTDPSDGW